MYLVKIPFGKMAILTAPGRDSTEAEQASSCCLANMAHGEK